jgi:hypothetical protein
MSGESRVLVVANVTATSREVIDALEDRAARGPCRFTLVVPAKHADDGGAGRARERLNEALDRMRNEGLTVDGGRVGDSDPVAAVLDECDRGSFDEIFVGTLPSGTSNWLEADVPQRIESKTNVPVQHVVATGSGWETFSR